MGTERNDSDLSNESRNLVGEDDEEEFIDDHHVAYHISTSGADFDVDGWVRRFENETIFRPDFQRNFVWTWPQASKFIESILLGLPIPSVFLFREDRTQKFLIIDGLQRLTTLHAFKTGHLPNGRRFRLKDVSPRFQDKTLEELDETDQRRFEDSIIHAMIIRQLVPDNDNSCVYHIFERLNTSSTPLHPQEIRAAAYHGEFQRMLEDLNGFEPWRRIFGREHKRSKDQELILRFLALRFDRQNYAKPMKGFLNTFMSVNRNVSPDDRQKFTASFKTTVERSYGALGKQAFRPSGLMNVAFYDALMVAIDENPSATCNDIKKMSQTLADDEGFRRYITDATSDNHIISGRINQAKNTLDALVPNHRQ